MAPVGEVSVASLGPAEPQVDLTPQLAPVDHGVDDELGGQAQQVDIDYLPYDWHLNGIKKP